MRFSKLVEYSIWPFTSSGHLIIATLLLFHSEVNAQCITETQLIYATDCNIDELKTFLYENNWSRYSYEVSSQIELGEMIIPVKELKWSRYDQEFKVLIPHRDPSVRIIAYYPSTNCFSNISSEVPEQTFTTSGHNSSEILTYDRNTVEIQLITEYSLNRSYVLAYQKEDVDALPFEEKVFPVEGSFNVAPACVFISPTKMNVLYRGVDNPLEISVPGVDPSNLIVSGTGVKKSGNGYIADVTRHGSGELKISVSVEDGNKTSKLGSKVFRVKNLPDAAGSIFGKTDGLMSANLIKKAKVEAKFNNFDFELPLRVTAFQIIVPPFAPIDCKGNTLSSNALAALDKAKPGTPVIIRNIRATTAKGIKPKVAPIVIDLN